MIEKGWSGLKCRVTVKSFDDQSYYDFLIQSIESAMLDVVTKLSALEQPEINIQKLNTIHIPDNYRDELFAFQKSVGHHAFTTQNKIATGHAQVIHVSESDTECSDLYGYHIFINKLIPMVILSTQYLLDNNDYSELPEMKDNLVLQRDTYLMMIRHELAHVEDETNQEQIECLKTLATQKTFESKLKSIALRFWEEYYACKRSAFNISVQKAANEFSNLINRLNEAEKEICSLRWKYNTMEITLEDFLKLFYEYIESSFIYCCYFAGHLDFLYDNLIKQLRFEDIPSRFFPFLAELWMQLRKIYVIYPRWNNMEIFDGLKSIIVNCAESFDVYFQNTDVGPYFSIPPKKLINKNEEYSGDIVDA